MKSPCTMYILKRKNNQACIDEIELIWVWQYAHLVIAMHMAVADSMPTSNIIQYFPSCILQNIVIDQTQKSQNTFVPYPTMQHPEQKCAHFCSDGFIVGYRTDALWVLWIRSIVVKIFMDIYHIKRTIFFCFQFGLIIFIRIELATNGLVSSYLCRYCWYWSKIKNLLMNLQPLITKRRFISKEDSLIISGFFSKARGSVLLTWFNFNPIVDK